MIKALKIGLIATFLIYACGLTYSYYSNEKFSKKVELYDLNKNGFIDNEEITKESKNIAHQMSKRKTTEQAIVLLIPFSIIMGFITFGVTILFNKIKVINDNEIMKTKSRRY